MKHFGGLASRGDWENSGGFDPSTLWVYLV